LTFTSDFFSKDLTVCKKYSLEQLLLQYMQVFWVLSFELTDDYIFLKRFIEFYAYSQFILFQLVTIVFLNYIEIKLLT
jgi:hypothetical protein